MATIHNEGYVFERDAPPDARAAFSSHPKKTLFPPGVEFRRFITAENRRTGDRGNQIFGSPWWFTKETFQRIVAHSDPRGLGIGDVARIQLAVPKEFNARMEWICVIYLTQPVFGWTGKAARQLATPGANIYFGGGGEQVYLPNLAADPLATASRYARMRFFGMCPD
jgi:hypothetical protein